MIVTLTGTDINLAGIRLWQSPAGVKHGKNIVVFHEHFKTRLIGHDPAFKRIAVIPQGVCLPCTCRKNGGFRNSAWQYGFLLPTGLRPVKTGFGLAAWRDWPMNSRVYLLIMGPVIDRTYAQGILQRIQHLGYYLEKSHTEISGILAAGDVVINYSESEPTAGSSKR